MVGTARTGLRDAFAPVQGALRGITSPVGDLFGGVARYRGLKSENAKLREELDRARADAAKGADAERERRILLALAGLDYTTGIRSIAARVISYAPSNFQVTIDIDRGAGHGFAVGMPVVTEAGLVGRVAAVTWERSTVLLLTDPSSAVGVRLAGSGEVGVLRGTGPRRPLPLDFIPVDTPVAPGEIVVTSGLQGALFPPRVPVGRVRLARTEPGALAQEVTLDPMVNLGQLEFVRVLLWKPPS